jgi:hypothetical protein
MATSSGDTAPVLTPAQTLARLATVDGNRSGLDADQIRGLNPDGTVPGTNFGNVPLAGQIAPSPHPGALRAQFLFYA